MEPAVSDETDDELEAIASNRARVVAYRGEQLEIRPLTVLRIRHFLPHVRPVIAALNERLGGVGSDTEVDDTIAVLMSQGTVLELIESHGEALAAAAAVAAGKPQAWVEEGDVDEFLELVTAVIAVNLDFFVHRLLPQLATTAAELGQVLATFGSGRTPSRPSSAPDTD